VRSAAAAIVPRPANESRPEGPLSIDPTEYRSIIGRLPTGVTVITAAVDGRLHGMTANAVTSLSLEPPMVLVCIDQKAHAHGVLERAGAFAVNVLGEHQEQVSRLFSVSEEPEPGRLRGVAFTIGRTGAPLLADCVAYLECRVREIAAGGDHSIFMGEVIHQGVVSDAPPLLFFRGQYRAVAGDSVPD
jgi:flavin reductase (DIM6/NTAB) family NADH-FMN oxidoreductase RutF